MPGDPRFLGAIRALAVQAASYAQFPAETGDSLAGDVARAAESAMQSSASDGAPIDVAFTGDESALTVVIGCESAAAAGQPDSSSNAGRSVDWQADGSRLTCHIRQAHA